MRLQGLLDQLRIDIVPAANDQFLLAAGEPEIIVRVLSAEIAGVQPESRPPFDPDPFVVSGIEIAGEHVRAADRDDADLVGLRVANVFVLGVEDQRAHVLIGIADADRADARRGFEPDLPLETQAPSVRP